MNSIIETLNQFSGMFLQFAWPMLWQSSVLISFVFALDFLLARKIRASVRYALWLVVLVKLLLPPTFALPTGAAWWLFQAKPAVKAPVVRNYTVTYDTAPLADYVPPTRAMPAPVPPKLNGAGWVLLASGGVSTGLLLWLAFRWWQVARKVRSATASEELNDALEAARRLAALGSAGRLKLVEGRMSPAICGLFRPVILLPRALAEKLSPAQLRAVLLHEMFHLRRRDVWVNCAQALLQIFYWWHPLLWFANARIRRLREEAVDDAVMLALREEADTYAPTLLEVAKLAFQRPLLSLGLVGIMESRSALRQRIERLVDFRAPRKAGMTFASLCGICVFSAVALPMGEAPHRTVDAETIQNKKVETHWPDPNFKGIRNINLMAQFLIIDGTMLRSQVTSLAGDFKPTLYSTGETAALLNSLKSAGAKFFNDWPDGICQPATSGALQHYEIGVGTNSEVEFLTTNWGGSYSNMLSGCRITMPATQPEWSPMDFNLRALIAGSGIQCDMDLTIGNDAVHGQKSQMFIPDGSTLIWVVKSPTASGECQLVMLTRRIEGTAATAASGILSDPNYRLELHALEQRGGAENLAEPVVVVTTSGRGINRITMTNISVPVPKADAAQLVQDGKLLYESGKLNEAEKKLKAALAVDANNARAQYYLGLVHTNWPATGLTYTGPGRQAIVRKLETIRLDEVSFKAVPLGEVLRTLAVESRKRDADQRGINFLINPNPDRAGDGIGFIDLNTGLPVITNAASVEDLGVLPITLKQALTNASLADVLDAVVLASPKPIKYSIQDFAVVFSPWKPSTPLFTRTFAVDTRTFAASLQAAGVDMGNGTNSDKQISAGLKKFFANLGVDFNSPPGKSVFYGDRLGRLFVKATEADLNTIEHAIEALNSVPPQVHIKARFLEVPKGTLSGLHQSWLSFNSVTGQVTAILSQQNVKTTLQAMQSRPGVEILAEPEATTTSGRQTQMRATTIITVVTNLLLQENVNNGSGSTAIVPQTSQVETGPVVDVVPYVLSDGYTINLAVIPSVTEFLGYTNANVSGLEIDSGDHLPCVSPSFQVCQMVATLNLWDGQTAVLGGMSLKKVITEKVPHVGDVPQFGQLFQSKVVKVTTNEILVFITANIVDSAGNPVHTNEELPFAKDSVPPQPSRK